jgi:hemoglobin/transferrin/lactoferrin receptor protein
MRQNFGSAHDGRFFIDPELLSSVEVLRGSSSSLYGSGGTGGVIEFRTANAGDFLGPDETYGIRTSIGYQHANEEQFGSLTAYGQPGYGVDLIANITYRDSGDIELGGGQSLSSDDQILGGMAKAGWSFGESHYLEASYLGFNGQVEEPNNGQGAGGNDMVDKDIDADSFRLAYNYTNPANPWLNLDAIAYYTESSNEEQRLDNLGAGPAGELLTREVATIGFRVDNRSNLQFAESANALFTYGFEYYNDDQKGAAGGAARDGVPNAESDSFGAFLQAEISLRDLGELPGELVIVPGVRFD